MSEKSRLLYEGHLGRITNLVYSPDGTLIASGGECEMAIRLWHAETLQLHRIFRLGDPHWHASNVEIAFSEDGKILFGAVGDFVLRAWNVDSGEILWERDCRPYYPVLSPNGRIAGLNGFRQGERFCKLLDLTTNQFLKASLPKGQWVQEFSVCGEFLLTISDDEDENPLWQVPHFFRVAAWTPIDAPLPNGLDNALGFTVFEGRTAVISTRRWAADETEPCFPHIYDVTSGELLAIYRPSAVEHPEFERDHFEVIPGTHRIISRRLHRKTQIEDIDDPDYRIIVELGPSYDTYLCPRSDGKVVAIGDGSGEVRLIDSGDGTIQCARPGITPISALALSPGGRYLACRRGQERYNPRRPSEEEIWLWDLADLRLVGRMTPSEPLGTFEAAVAEGILRYEPVSKTMVFRDSDAEARRMRVSELVRERYSKIFSLSRDAQWLVVYKGSKSLEVIDLVRMQTAYEETIRASETYPYSMAISEDGSKIGVSFGFTQGPNAVLFDQKRRGAPREASFWDSVDAFAFRPDGQAVALSATYRPSIAILSEDRRRKPSFVEGHVQTVRSLVYTPDGRSLISGGADGQIILWDAQSMRREGTLMVIGSGEDVEWAAFDDDTILQGSPGSERRFRTV